MNRVSGQLQSIQTHLGMSLITCQTKAGILSAVVIDTPLTAPWLQVGKQLTLLFKESEVWPLPPELDPIMPHFLIGEVVTVQTGVLLNRIECKTASGRITSLVDGAWLEKLSLTVGASIRLGVHPAAVALQGEKES